MEDVESQEKGPFRSSLVLTDIPTQMWTVPPVRGIAPVGAVAFSPVTDLTLTGESFDSRVEADPYFTKS